MNDETICKTCSQIDLRRMFCIICYNDNLPARKFKKKDRKKDSGICLPCQGAVNRYYTKQIKNIRKPGKKVKDEAWDKSIQAARIELCIGYSDAKISYDYAKKKQMYILSIRRIIYESTRKFEIPLDLIRYIETYTFAFCKGNHCNIETPWALSAHLRDDHNNKIDFLCYDCKQCNVNAPVWFPRIGKCPPVVM